MDPGLTPAGASVVMRRMAESFLRGPAITELLGRIRLAPHQIDAASRVVALLRHAGGAVLADVTGMGKTYVAIAVARVSGRTLVVAPAALRGMWREALDATGVVATVDSYEALSRAGGGRRERPELLILDEAHHARNPSTRRYAALAELAWGARVLLVSATPIHNRHRDLRALVALFAGSRAHHMTDVEMQRLVVRRSFLAGPRSSLPRIATPVWLEVPAAGDVLNAIERLPPGVPAADGSPAHALVRLGLIRAWCSSVAALRATLRRRLRQAAALEAALEAGHFPDRRELSRWPVLDDAVQLGFPGLFESTVSAAGTHDALATHTAGVRSLLRLLDSSGSADECRARHLDDIRARHAGVPVVAFTQFADTAEAMYRHCATRGGAALVSGSGARVASGSIGVDVILHGFDIEPPDRPPKALPLEVLITTDVLSEGLSLRRAGVLVHLDLPWTVARLEQRVGRLKRMGSPHRLITVYAIGPPVAARELAQTIRALQRKARVGATIEGVEELARALPFTGPRLVRMTRASARTSEPRVTEDLRTLMAAWTTGGAASASRSDDWPSRAPAAVVLVDDRGMKRLLAVTPAGVSDRPSDVLAIAGRVPAPTETSGDGPIPQELSVHLERWLQEQRAVHLVAPALDAPSAVHTSVLNALQRELDRAARPQRITLSARIARCRQLVSATRGIGAEEALARLVRRGALDLDALERMLQSTPGVVESRDDAIAVEALLVLDADSVSAFQAVMPGGSRHPDRPRSSSHPGERGATQG